jgi:erythromycin esterase-like protein/predicted phosphoribosyltransferase
MRFRDRAEAGRRLAAKLTEYEDRFDVLVLALPRGGVPVGFEVAAQLDVPLDVFLVRKLGVPGHPELAMGAIAAGGVQVLHQELIADLGIPVAAVAQVAARERLELERRDAAFRGSRPQPVIADRTIILVDDGLATGATMEAAIVALRRMKPARIVVAVPVGARDTCDRLRSVADRIVCLEMPTAFQAVGLWYENFAETTDDEVRQLLASAAQLSHRAPQVAGRAAPVDVVRQRAVRLAGDPAQYDQLIHAIGDARIVLLGEATHGTHEFYRERAFITRRLITEKHFDAVAVEADWPDAYRVNRYVRGAGSDQDAAESLADFGRFPTWMWRNADVLDFIGWLRTHDDSRPAEDGAGFYGLDLYSLRASMEAVLRYLDKVDPDAARRARRRYGCFDQFGEHMDDYSHTAGLGLSATCEREVVTQLIELQRARADYASRDGRVAADDYFFAEQNARLVRSAEEYYRTMFRGRVESWNIRDRHMASALKELMKYLSRPGRPARIVIWAHNSHLGDARATDMGEAGEVNVGQLVRGTYGNESFLVGFTTDHGTVTAATDWDEPAQRRQVRPALAGSFERLFHETGVPRLMLPLRFDADLAAVLSQPRLERAIGVIYRPDTERQSHYFHARLARQFDFVLHFDETRAVEPLERAALWEEGEPVETYPTGL